MSLTPQLRCDLAVKRRDIRSTNVFGTYAAVASYQERDRQSEHSSIEFTRLRIAHHNRVVYFVALIEFAYRFWSIIHGNADDLQTLVAVFVL